MGTTTAANNRLSVCMYFWHTAAKGTLPVILIPPAEYWQKCPYSDERQTERDWVLESCERVAHNGGQVSEWTRRTSLTDIRFARQRLKEQVNGAMQTDRHDGPLERAVEWKWHSIESNELPRWEATCTWRTGSNRIANLGSSDLLLQLSR